MFGVSIRRMRKERDWGGEADFLAFDLEPLDHSMSSAAAFFAFSAAAFWEATSAFCGVF